MRTMDLEDVVLFLDELRLDHPRRHYLREGGLLMREAVTVGLISDLSQPWEFCQHMQHARRVGLIEWTPASYDRSGDDLMNAREFVLTSTGLQHARDLKAFPRFLLAAQNLEEELRRRGWNGPLDELARAEEEFRAKRWDGAVARFYSAVESGLKFGLDELGVEYGAGMALKRLASQAAELGIIPASYQGLFGFLDSIRSPRWHGQGARPSVVEVGAAEALLMGSHARSLLLYLVQRLQAS